MQTSVDGGGPLALHRDGNAVVVGTASVAATRGRCGRDGGNVGGTYLSVTCRNRAQGSHGSCQTIAGIDVETYPVCLH